MKFSRNHILATIVVLLFGYGAWKFFAGDGTVTVNFTNAPLHKVISAIEWQGRVNIATNIDPNKPVTLKLDHASVYDAMDTLSVRVDGNLRLAYIGAPTSAQIRAAVEAYQGGLVSNQWKIFSVFQMADAVADGDSTFDPRKTEITIASDPAANFQSVLDQMVQKSGAMAAIPSDWNPLLKQTSLTGSVTELFPKLASMANGRVKEYFLITAQPHTANGQNWGGPQSEIIGVGAGHPNMDWMLEHAQAVVNSLPADQKADAQSQVDMFKSMRKLTPEQRRKMFDDPAFQERIADHMEKRMDKMSPDQRSQRMANYVARKAAGGIGPGSGGAR